MLLLQQFNPLVLSVVLPNELTHVMMLLYVQQVLLQGETELIDVAHKVRAHTHDHLSDVVLPTSNITASFHILLNGLSCAIQEAFKLLLRLDVAFVDILHVCLVNETRETLVCLVLA